MAVLSVIPAIAMLITGFVVCLYGTGKKNDLVGWIGTILVCATFTLMVVGDIAATLQGVFALIFVVAAAAATGLAAHDALEAWFHRADAGQS